MNSEIEQIDVNLEQEDARFFDLAEEESRKQLEAELGQGSTFFKPVTDITYKVKLTSTKVKEVKKVFNDEEITKYALEITAVDKNQTKFEGTWEVGAGILRNIFKGYEADCVFAVTKTGSGLDTRYAVVKDF